LGAKSATAGTPIDSTVRFPEGFLWGTATAAHQVEGGNWNNDWWLWEHTPSSGCAEPSGDACDSWNRWLEDVELVADMALGTYRFSLEWSRIEPEEGEWSDAAMARYRAICQALLDRGIQPTVTLHHFTTPRWVVDRGGWEDPATAQRFARFCGRAAGELHDVVGRVCTINEPNVVALCGWLAGVFPPGKQDVDLRRRVNETFVQAHRMAVDAVRAAAPGVPVGLTLAMSELEVVDGGEAKADRIRRGMEDIYLNAVAGDDFLGVQTYTRQRVGPDGVLGPGPDVPVTGMGWEYRPEALEATLRRAWEYTDRAVPLLVTENGIATDDDQQRIAYLQAALQGVGRCLEDGIDVRGYLHWSLLDNFEWARGYAPHFGLVSVERPGFTRTPKPSAKWFGAVAAHNLLT
jgi:beta-glucosidase